jgi:hypothetical protein
MKKRNNRSTIKINHFNRPEFLAISDQMVRLIVDQLEITAREKLNKLAKGEYNESTRC